MIKLDDDLVIDEELFPWNNPALLRYGELDVLNYKPFGKDEYKSLWFGVEVENVKKIVCRTSQDAPGEV